MSYLPKAFFLVFLACCLAACGSTATPAATAASEKVSTFGAEFDTEEVLAARELTTSFSTAEISDTVRVALRGQVNEVCQKKGCWMTIAAGESDEMMVKFKDYGFFVPLDISGREVIMNGTAYYQITPVEELRHYAEDAGKSEAEIAAITEPKRELRFLADGVKLLSGEM